MDKKIKVLAIDDDKLICQAYLRGFEKAGFEIKTFEDGPSALEAVDKFKPDVILLDLMMPVMSGEEVLKKMKAKGITDKTPVIVLTNKSDGQSMKLCTEMGAKDYITKVNFNFGEVIKKIKELVN